LNDNSTFGRAAEQVSAARPSIWRQLPAGAGPVVAGLALVVFAFALRSWAPLLAWLLPFALAALACRMVWREIATADRRTIRWLGAGCLVAHVAVQLSTLGYNPAAMTWWRDDHNYYRESIAIADAWRAGSYPDISLKGAPPYLGTLHTGYHRAVASAFFISGNSVVIARLINAACGAALVFLLGMLANALFSRVTEIPRGFSPAVLAAGMAALHPAQYYYSQFLLKDTYTAAWFITCTVLLCDALQQRRVLSMLAAACGLYILFTLRAYAALSLVIGLFAYLVLLLPTRAALAWGSLSALVGFLVVRYYEPVHYPAMQMWQSIVELAPQHARSPGAVAVHLLRGIPRLLLAPFSWIYALGEKPLYPLYPAMWFLYLLVYPAMFAGLWRALRLNLRAAVVPLMGILGGSFILLMANYAGDAPRQRFYMEYIAIAFAALGWTLPRRRVFIGWYLVLAAYAIGQVITVKMRGL